MSRQLVKTFLAMANKETEENCMFSILSQLKEAGAQLEEEHKEDMDRVQEELIKLCQNREEDLEIRLMMLEIIEVCTEHAKCSCSIFLTKLNLTVASTRVEGGGGQQEILRQTIQCNQSSQGPGQVSTISSSLSLCSLSCPSRRCHFPPEVRTCQIGCQSQVFVRV